MPPPPPAPSPPEPSPRGLRAPQWSPEDTRFRALVVGFAAVAAVLVAWAQGVEPVETLPMAVPERILEVVRLEHPPPPPREAQSRSRPTRGGPGRAAPRGRAGPGMSPLEDDEAAVVRHLMRVFSHPVFGPRDPGEADLERALDGVVYEEWTQEADPGLRMAAGGDGRDDAELSGGISRFERPDVLAPDALDTAPSARFATARAAPRFERPPEVSDAAIASALRSWKKHAASCRDRTAPAFRGRVVVRLELAEGGVEAVHVDSDDHPPQALRHCLETRARRLLRFPPDERGHAELPLVYE